MTLLLRLVWESIFHVLANQSEKILQTLQLFMKFLKRLLQLIFQFLKRLLGVQNSKDRSHFRHAQIFMGKEPRLSHRVYLQLKLRFRCSKVSFQTNEIAV